jgi:hypothetical protein
MCPAPWVGKPDVKVVLKKRQWQWVIPDTKEFDINISNYISVFDSQGFEVDNATVHPDLGVATVTPLLSTRNNFIENINTTSQDRYRVEVPKGAPPETANEINKRVWIASPTINQTVSQIETTPPRKRADQEFAPPGSTTDLSGNVVDNRYPGPIWAEEFHESASSGDPTVKRAPPVSWVHQKNSNPNCEFFICQKYGNFTNEPFWITVRKFRSERPANIPAEEFEATNAANRFDRYQSGENLFNYFAIRIGAISKLDTSDPKGYDIVFPVGGTPFIYDHEGEGFEVVNNSSNSNNFVYKGYVASRKDNWMLSNDTEEFNIMVWVIRGKIIIKAPSLGPGTWYFPEDLANKPFPESQARYSNISIRASNVCLMGRGMKFRFNFNPMEFNIYKNNQDPGATSSLRGYHGRMIFSPFPVRDFAGNSTNGGWLDYDVNTPDGGFQNYTAVPHNKDDQETGINAEEVMNAYGFDYVADKYDDPQSNGISSSDSYTSMMIAVNPDFSSGSSNSIRDIIKTEMRFPTASQSSVYPPFGGPGFEIDGQGLPIFENRLLYVDLKCKAPTIGENTQNISARFATPILWRLKGKMVVPPIPEPPPIDITDFVTEISYESSGSDMFTLEQNFTVTVRVPKQHEFDTIPSGDPFDIYSNPAKAQAATSGVVTSRQELLDLLLNGVNQVEIWLGWWGVNSYRDDILENPQSFNNPFSNSLFTDIESGTKDGSGKRIKVFTGVSKGGPIKETYGNDIVSLRCVDKLNLLKDYFILNSPFFDFMRLDKAFLKCAKLTGLHDSNFDVRSRFAERRVLSGGYSFTEPLWKFEDNTNVYDALKKICGIFGHVLQTDPDGTIVMTDLFFDFNLTDLVTIQDIQLLPLTHNSYAFHVDGWGDRRGFTGGGTGEIEGLEPWVGFGTEGQTFSSLESVNQNPFQRCYEVLNSDKQVEHQISQFSLVSIDRLSGGTVIASAIDLPAIEDPTSKNFLGYRKIGMGYQPAFGEDKKVKDFIQRAKSHFFQAPLKVNFSTFGRPTLRPLDIISVVHQDPKTILIQTSRGNPLEVVLTEIKYRVVKVAGSIKYNDNSWQWKMDVEGEKI